MKLTPSMDIASLRGPKVDMASSSVMICISESVGSFSEISILTGRERIYFNGGYPCLLSSSRTTAYKVPSKRYRRENTTYPGGGFELTI
jgi:hypothetical protein